MLVLSRRVGESVVIGDDIVVSVLEVRGDVVRIGVDAPRSVQVRRQELVAQVEQLNRAAASPSADAVAGLSKLVRDGNSPAPSAPQDEASAGEPEPPADDPA